MVQNIEKINVTKYNNNITQIQQIWTVYQKKQIHRSQNQQGSTLHGNVNDECYANQQK